MEDIDLTLDCFLYHSCLATNASPSCVADIVKTARAFNHAQGITGLLIFDGQRFCQYMEGPSACLQALVSRISADPRHMQFAPAFAERNIGVRRFERWSMAYVLVDEIEPLETLRLLQGRSALEQLCALLPGLDMA